MGLFDFFTKKIESIKEEVNEYYAEKERLEKEERERILSEFLEKTFSDIPPYNILATGEKVKRTYLKDLEDIKHTNITKSTSSDKYFRFVSIDIETTGLDSRSEIIEVGAVKWVDFEPIEYFSTLCKANSPISEEATKVNHITDDMIADKPHFYEIIPDLADFIGDYSLVGHNIDFDLKFLRLCGLQITEKKRLYFDTLDLSRKRLKKVKYDSNGKPDYSKDFDVEDYKLATVCRFFKIENPDVHRALCDAYVTGKLFENLIILITN